MVKGNKMAKNSKKKPGLSKKAAYTAYSGENRQEKNKIKKMLRHVKNNKNDEKAALDFKRVKATGNTYKRRDNRSAVHKNSGLDNKLTAMADRRMKIGAVTVNVKGEVVQKPIPKKKHTRRTTSMELAFNRLGITRRARFSRAL